MLSSTTETQAAPEAVSSPPSADASAPLANDAAELTIHDGVIYNADGEIVGLDTSAPEPVSGDDPDESEANRVLRAMSRTHFRQEAAEMRFAELDRELTAMRKAALDAIAATPEYRSLIAEADQCLNISRKAEDRLGWLTATYTEFLRLFALPRLSGRSRTLETLVGSISLRKVAARIRVEDDDQAAPALLSLGETAAIKQTVLLSGISDDLSARILAGEANLSGIALVPETTKVGVSVGGVKLA